MFDSVYLFSYLYVHIVFVYNARTRHSTEFMRMTEARMTTRAEGWIHYIGNRNTSAPMWFVIKIHGYIYHTH